MATIHVGRDNDIDNLTKETKTDLIAELRKAIAQLQQCISGLDGEGNAPALTEIASTHAMMLRLLGQLEALQALKACMSARPAAYVHGEEKVSERLANDEPYNCLAASSAIVALKDAKLLRFWALRSRHNVIRYKFLKPPADHPLEYRVFRKIADYFGVELGLTGTSIVADWNRTPTRFVSGLSDLLESRTRRSKS